MRTDPVYGCFNNPKGLNHGNFLSGCVSWVCELANGLSLGITIPSQDLSGTWVSIHA
jgi:hypothetical protein